MTFRIVGPIVFAVAALLSSTFAFAADPPSDSWITTKAKVKLLTTDGVDGTAVHVDTVKGVVTLHGKVKSDLMRQRAIEAVKIPGVVSVRSLLQVVPKTDEKFVESVDDAIKDKIKKALKDDDSLDNSRISVKSVDKGVVLLSGSANSDIDLLAAISHAATVPGVRHVATEIKTPRVPKYYTTTKTETKEETKTKLTKNTGTDPDMVHKPMPTSDQPKGRVSRKFMDAETTTAVKLQLMRAEDVPAMDINVDTNNGFVTLFGIVPTAQAKLAAENAARKVDGVRNLENQIEVVADAKRETVDAKDSDVQKDVKKELGRVAAFKKIDVETKNGVVRLTGTVNDTMDQLSAVTVARSVNGVRAVQNELKMNSKDK